MVKCPCKDCVCIPICKLKEYPILIRNCEEVWNYLSNPFPSWSFTDKEKIVQRENGRISMVHKILNPTNWQLTYDEYNRVIVENQVRSCNWTFYY